MRLRNYSTTKKPSHAIHQRPKVRDDSNSSGVSYVHKITHLQDGTGKKEKEYRSDQEEEEKEKSCGRRYQSPVAASKLVVFWTSFWGSWENWDFLETSSKLREMRCAFWRCDLVWTKRGSRERVSEADAVVFFSFDLNLRDLPPRKPHQLWIRLELEAPPLSQHTTGAWSAAEDNGIYFNLTMSYHHLSNITTQNTGLRPLDVSTECPSIEGNELDVSSTTYKTYIEHLRNYDDIMHMEGSALNQMILSQSRRFQKGNAIQEVLMKDEMANRSYSSSENHPTEPQKKLAPSTEGALDMTENIIQTTRGDGRTKNKFHFTDQEVRWALRSRIAVWMASNCPTDSKREDFVAALQRHVKVTTIGKCGEMKCGRNHLDRFCYRWIAGSHLFYLSLENALCDDYTSEKLWRPMEYGMVPIVYGGADYDKILPPGSYINSQSFQNISALAKYLVYLGNNPVSYLRYFQWRRYWESKEPLPWTCNLCNTLHKIAGVREQWVTLDQWWNDTSECYDPFF
ncbi:uncharacterized protein LOC135222465 [Macrobrachium nipponense]|uniref:uncharacterized protein LOC135222465 n=1 Tax=Macrobrachium nipponense TaxID=159736 RepID=UPI0030C8C695